MDFIFDNIIGVPVLSKHENHMVSQYAKIGLQ